MEEKEIELIDYLNAFWKRKWIIILGTLSLVIITTILCFIAKPVYQVNAIVQPGKMFVENLSGNFSEVVVESPIQIADKIKQRSYDALIAADLNMSEYEIYRTSAEFIVNTLLTKMWVKGPDIELGKKILNSLINQIKKDLDEKIDVEINNIDFLIKECEIDKERRGKEIESLKTRLKIIDKRKKDIIIELDSIKKGLENIKKSQVDILKKENKSESESLGLLLYSVEIQQTLFVSDQINEKLSRQRLDEAQTKSDIQEEYSEIRKLDNTSANLRERKGRIDYTKVVKEPTSSNIPIYPKKKLFFLVSLILGLIIFTMIAFLLEYVEKKKGSAPSSQQKS